MRCAALLPLVAGSHDCRNVFILAPWIVVGGAAASMRISVTVAHAGRVGERFR